MTLGRGSLQVPDLPEPCVVLVFGQSALLSLFLGRLSIGPRLPLHKDELNITFDDGVGLKGFTQKAMASAHFVIRIRNFVPDNWVEVVKPDVTALHANV